MSFSITVKLMGIVGLAAALAAGSPSTAKQTANGTDTYTVAFASFAPINTDIFVAAGDGSAAKPLQTGPGQDYNAEISRDGKWVVFTSERAGSADIYRVRSNGTALQKLVTDPSFDDQGVLSPDGTKLAFVSDRTGQADVWVMDLGTRALTNVSNHAGGDFRPSWSPDGQWLAFSSDRESPGQKFAFVTLHSTALYISRADGSDLRRVTPAGEFAGSPTWSADGKRLLYYRCELANVNSITSPRRLRGTTQIAAVDVASGAVQDLTNGPGEKWSPRWLPHGRLAYVSGGPDGGLEFMAGDPGPRGILRSPSWSADGKTMVFHREISGDWPPFQRWAILDKRFSLVRTGVFPSYAPSGEKIFLNDQTAGNLHNNIIAIGADGTPRETIFHDDTRSALAPVVSPDGKRLAFGFGGFFQAVRGKAQADIAVVNSDGSGLTVLTDGSGNYGLPDWSPDGRRIVYRAAGSETNGLFILDMGTREVRHMPGTTSNDNFPAWSPREDLISFTSNRDGDYEIYTVRPDGSELTRLTRTPGNDAHNRWSPDGQWIAFTSSEGGFKDEAVLHPYNPQPYGDLYIMRADGTDVRRLTNNQYEEGTPTWAPR